MIRLLTESDKPQIDEYLARHEIETTFLYSNIADSGIDNNKEKRRCADYYGFFEGLTLKGILPFYNMGSCIPHFETENAMPEFVELSKTHAFDIILGMSKFVKPLYDQIQEVKPFETYHESLALINRKHKPFLLSDVAFVDVDGESSDGIVDFLAEARLKGFHQPISHDDMRKQLVNKVPDQDFVVAESKGRYVATGCVNAYTPTTGQIAGVFTAEGERGKGYCKATVSELCRRIIGKGKTPTLFVVKDNMPAVKAYEALGFEYFDDYLMVRLKAL